MKSADRFGTLYNFLAIIARVLPAGLLCVSNYTVQSWDLSKSLFTTLGFVLQTFYKGGRKACVFYFKEVFKQNINFVLLDIILFHQQGGWYLYSSRGTSSWLVSIVRSIFVHVSLKRLWSGCCYPAKHLGFLGRKM